MRWFRSAARRGDAASQFRLSEGYRHGRGVPQSDDKALGWLERAADGGNLDACLALGIRYSKGDGIPIDYILAHSWLARSRTDFRPATRRLIKSLEEVMNPEQIAESNRREAEWRVNQRGREVSID